MGDFIATNALELILVLLGFLLGLIIGLVIDTLRRKRYNKISSKVLEGIYDSEQEMSPEHDYHRMSYHSAPYQPKRSFQGLSSKKIVIEQPKSRPKRNDEPVTGKWICPQCGANDANLIHRKGCDKCYKS